MSKHVSNVRLTDCSSTREPVVERDPIRRRLGTLPPSLLRKVRSTAACALVSAGIWVGACLDGTGVEEPPTATSWPGVVSDPVVVDAPANSEAASLLGSTSGTDLVYISLAPGTIPGGEVAVIRNLRTGSSSIIPLVAEGFDPVAVSAAVGDTIAVMVRDASGGVVFEARTPVAAARPPVVVRTEPPPRKRDVPLNANMVIVFSEPIDPATMTTATVQLRTGSTPIAGRLEFRDVAHLTAAFVPDAPLEANATFTLMVTAEIRDLDGQPLEGPVTVEFTTGAALDPGTVASLTVEPSRVTATPIGGWALSLKATPRDAAGNELPNAPVTWSSSNPGVVPNQFGLGHVTNIGVFAAPGTVTIGATSGGRATSAVVTIDYVTLAAISGTESYGCGLTPTGAAYCWGYGNGHGELGYGIAHGDAIGQGPVAVAGGLSFASISSNWGSTCALTSEGAAYCWGSNTSGGLGDATTAHRSTPVAVLGGLRFSTISAGHGHTCAVTSEGAGYCWGNNTFGQLGDGSTTNRSTPVLVSGGLVLESIVASEYTCGVTTAGAAYCWGDGSLVPVVVEGGLTFSRLDSHRGTCALATNGAAHCWGPGTLENGTWVYSPRPVAVPGGLTFTQIAVAGLDIEIANCGLTVTGEAYCWGGFWWSGGILERNLPTRVPGLNFLSLSRGGSLGQVCGLAADGIAYCWGIGDLAPYPIRGQQ